MASRIYLIRHGITEGNQKMWFYGKADLPLAKEGEEKLRKLAKKDIYPKITDSERRGLIPAVGEAVVLPN